MKKIAIIGGAGFIGKNFVNFFSGKEYQINAIDLHGEDVQGVDNVKFVDANIQHTKELINAVEDAEAVIWLVHASVPATMDDSLVDDFLLNVSPIIKFLESSEKLPKLKKFVYLSSGGTVYGDVSEHIPIGEDALQRPISNYGISKSVAEKYIEYLTKDKNIESIVFRPSNVYGKYQNMVKPQGIIGFAFKAIRDNVSMDLYNEGKVIRDFIHVIDLADAVEKSINTPLKINETTFYNAGSKQGFSMKEIISRIETITNHQLEIVNKSSRKFDCEYNVLDNEKAEKELGWQINIPMHTGLLEVWEWIKQEKNSKTNNL